MQPGYIILLSLVPLILGGLIIWAVFRNINRKYCGFFDQMISVAATNPSQLRRIIAGDAARQAGIASKLSLLKKTVKTEIVKVGKQRTQLNLHATGHSGATEKFHVVMEMQIMPDQSRNWQITEFEQRS